MSCEWDIFKKLDSDEMISDLPQFPLVLGLPYVVCKRVKSSFKLQKKMNWNFTPTLLLLRQEEKDPKMPSIIPQLPQRRRPLQRWTTAWRPPGRWTQGWTLCFSARWESLREEKLEGKFSGQFLTRPAAVLGTAGQGPTSWPRLTRVVFDSDFAPRPWSCIQVDCRNDNKL